MAFVKVVKNRAYFKRFQVKYRRRREGKTDYGARRVMVRQDKNKYNSAKYRLIVRFTNRRCIAQIVYATIGGDKVMAHADSTQLEKYGLKVGLKNYAAGYCVGLLLARRVLDKVGLADAFEGQKEIDGEEFHVEDDYDGDRRPFKAILDIGLKRTTVGSKVFSVLKGAADGGLHVPHSTKKFPGYKPASGDDKGEYDADFHKQRIFGGHVGEHMESLKEEDEQEYEKVYSSYISAEVDCDDLEELYEKVHEAIREDPAQEKKESTVAKPTRDGNDVKSNGKTWTRMVRLTFQERKERVAARIAKHAEKMLAED
jgi:large subunit ribosomal protein L5e